MQRTDCDMLTIHSVFSPFKEVMEQGPDCDIQYTAACMFSPFKEVTVRVTDRTGCDILLCRRGAVAVVGAGSVQGGLGVAEMSDSK